MTGWSITETQFDSKKQHHHETIFTIGNGYLSTRGAFEEGYPGDRRATFMHGVFDAAPLVVTELANAPDWLALEILLNGERFTLDRGRVIAFERVLDLRTGVLTRRVEWESPFGARATLLLERFTSLASTHSMFLRASVTPETPGTVEMRAALNGNAISQGAQGEKLVHWDWQAQGEREGNVYLQTRTFRSHIELGAAMRLMTAAGRESAREFWDVRNGPTIMLRIPVAAGETITVEKHVSYYTSRDMKDGDDKTAMPVEYALQEVTTHTNWQDAYVANAAAWDREWERTDVVIEGDAEAQLAIRFNLFQLLIAAPRHDDRVNIGAKTLSGFGYRGHAFWDTEIFMLPLFIYTAPHIAKNLLNYRYRLLDAARAKAKANGFEGAQFPWESADTGEEVTPTWLPHPTDRAKLVRIWTGDIELHISADIAYAAHQYWVATADDEWMISKGSELVLDTAKFWVSRAEWNSQASRYEYNDVIGPDEYHEHVNNNYYTNRLAQWNIQTALEILEWLRARAPDRAAELVTRLELDSARLDKWRNVSAGMYLPALPDGLLLQFEDYMQRREVDLAAMEPRTISVQQHFGIEGTNETQALKQPDVLMLMYLLKNEYSDAQVRLNYDFYTPRTDHTFGSSLGPSIQAIMACRVGKPDDAYEHFIRALRADLYDVRGNANDGIHAASAGGTWQAVVFGFGGLNVTQDGWTVQPQLPKYWRRLKFRFFYHGEQQQIELTNRAAGETAGAKAQLRGVIFDLDGVITDTAEYHYRGWKRLADENGWAFDRAKNDALRGVARRESLMLILGERAGEYSEPQIQEFMARKNNYYLELIREITPRDLLPGARELLGEIRAAGVKVALGSASKNAREVLGRLGIGELFDTVADGHSVERQKPAPDLFLHAAAQLGLGPGECIVVEDAEAGIQAARVGGFVAVGVGPVSRFSGADAVFPGLKGVHYADLLKAFNTHTLYNTSI